MAEGEQVKRNREIRALEKIDLLVTFRWFLAVLINYGVITLCLYLAITYDRWWLYLMAIFIMGTRMHSLAILGHDAAHFLVTKNKTLNNIFGNALIFYPFTLRMRGYRGPHIEHHKYFGSQFDPELMLKRERPHLWDVPLRRSSIFKNFLKDLVGGGVGDIVDFFKVAWGGRTFFSIFCFVSYTIIILLNIFLVLDISTAFKILFLWYITLGTAFWAFFRLRIYTEHIGTASVHRIYAPFWTRLLFVPVCTWYHFEHHYNYHIPWFRLKKLREIDPRPDVPVRDLGGLLYSYATLEQIPGGTPLRHLKDDGSETSVLT